MILVTGGLGYIGSHTVVELQKEGFDVVLVDNLSNTSIDVLDGIEAITGKRPFFEKFDLREKSKVKKLFAKYDGIVGVMHFAASKAVGESVDKPLLYYENNLCVLISLLQELTKKDEANFIFSSSCTIYGRADELPITEETPIKLPESPYGNTKQVGEEIIRDSCQAFPRLQAISLRYFNLVGAHPSTLIGELPLGVPQNLVPYITQTAIGLRKQLSVFGDDYPTPDGTCIRDYIHVVDLEGAHVKALQRLLNKKNHDTYEVFNLGTGKGSSVFEVIGSFERVSGHKLKFNVVERRKGDMVQAYADIQKANHVLGWNAKCSLEEAIKSAWEWEQRIRNGSTNKLYVGYMEKV